MDSAHGHEFNRRFGKFGTKQESSKSVEGIGVRGRESLREAIELSKRIRCAWAERGSALDEQRPIRKIESNGLEGEAHKAKPNVARPNQKQTGAKGDVKRFRTVT